MAYRIGGTNVITDDRELVNTTIVNGISTTPFTISQLPFYQNSQTVTQNYIVPAATNALTVGPVQVVTGVTVNVTSGSYWKVI